jgi:hypothetical protein
MTLVVWCEGRIRDRQRGASAKTIAPDPPASSPFPHVALSAPVDVEPAQPYEAAGDQPRYESELLPQQGAASGPATPTNAIPLPWHGFGIGRGMGNSAMRDGRRASDFDLG